MDNKSLEPFFNDDVSEADGTKRNLRVNLVNQPLEGYELSNSEVNIDGTSYYGYEDKDGNYVIKKAVTSGNQTTYTFAKGTSGYATAWVGRAGLTYASFADTF